MRRRTAAKALLGIGALAVVPAAKAARARPALSQLDNELAAITGDAAQPLASLSVIAIRRGDVAYQGHFGHRFIDPEDGARNLPTDERTMYRIASVSKLVTALAVMKRVEGGGLSLDRDVGDSLGYPLRNPHFPDEAITLRHLLSHTSSLSDEGGYSWPEGVDLRDVLGADGKHRAADAMWSRRAPPGHWFSYANLPWGVIGTVLERESGERFDRLLRREVLEPLGVHGGFDPAELPRERVAHIATLYRKRTIAGEREAWNPRGPWVAQVDDYSREAPRPKASEAYRVGTNGTLFAPQGGLRASAADLARVMRMLMGRGALDGRRFLQAQTVDAMLSVQWRHDRRNGAADYGRRKGRFQAWGLGNQRFLDVGGPAFGDRLVEGGGFAGAGHLGDAWGLSAVFVLDPASRDGMISLCGGTGFDPDATPGRYSSFSRFEERILTALHRRAIAADAG